MASKINDELDMVVTLAEAAIMWARDDQSISRRLKRLRVRTRRAGKICLIAVRDLERAYGPPVRIISRERWDDPVSAVR